MRNVVWALLIAAVVIYWLLVWIVGFSGPLALGVNFLRVAVAVGVLIFYVPAIASIFIEVPAPRRDYLLAGIVLSWSSALLFAIGNEAGRIFDIDMSIFLNPVGGFFSLILVSAGVFHLVAPAVETNRSRYIAMAIGVVLSAALVFLAPLFR